MEANPAGRFGDRLSVRRIDDVIRAIQDFEATPRARRRAFHRPGCVGERFEWLIEHEQVSAEDQQRSERERAGENVQRAQVIHRGCSHHHERADNERAVHVREGETKVGVQTLLRLQMKLANLPFLAPEGVDHSHGAQAFLRLGQQSTLLLLNRGRFAPNSMREKINGANN